MKLKNCIVISDSFKGTLSSAEIAELYRDQVPRFFPDCRITALPAADGGEGTAACMVEACGGRLVQVDRIQNPLGEEISSFYGLLPNGTAVIEMAAAAGLPLIEGREDPLTASTYGVGQLMARAIDAGARRLILGLGGSATTDCGCGCAAALGAVFIDEQGSSFVPTGGTLEQVAHIDLSGLKQRLSSVELTAMCDVDNPMYGPNGAAYVYAPQKGADASQVSYLDRGLRSVEAVIRRELGCAVADIPGAGAAGAFGAGVLAFLEGNLRSGIEVVLDTVGFDRLLEDADLVFTGEGRLDSQSLQGKVVSGVARRAGAKQVPVIALVGDVAPGACETALDLGVTAVFSTNQRAVPFAQARLSSQEDYISTLQNVLRVLKLN